jgi:putative polyketide hydroxylase
MSEARVLIVGGGPVGLAAALELARHDVQTVLVERQREPSHHPKARGFRIRTMELFRLWGLESYLRGRSPTEEAARFIYCDTLAGEELGRTPDVTPLLKRFSPSAPCRVPQDVVEALLRRQVERAAQIETRFGVECLELVEDDDAVVATLRDSSTGELAELSATYAIAADGVSSGIRSALGIEMEGNPLIAHWQSIYWRGDIDDLTADRPCIQFLTNARSGRFVTVAMVDAGRWVTLVMRPPSDTRPADPSRRDSIELVRAAVGRPQLAVELVDVTTWRLSAQIATRMRSGRIFLAGDAAHALPPTGGFGMNTGLQDVHNLAWKLALVLQGRAEARLLDSYETERHPVAEANASWSAGNAHTMMALRSAIAEEDQRRVEELLNRQRLHIAALSQDLGFKYLDGALLPEDAIGADEPADADLEGFRQSAAPGHRAPHVWLAQAGREQGISTLDLFGVSFVLLAGPAGTQWRAAAARAAKEIAIPIDVALIGTAGEYQDPDDDFLATYGIKPSGAVLVRPDGHVAWRTSTAGHNPDAQLLDALLAIGIKPAAAAEPRARARRASG